MGSSRSKGEFPMLARQLRVEVANLMDSLVETGAKSPTDGLVSPTSVAVAMMHRRPPSSDTMHRGRTFKSPTILADGCCATTATKECDALPVDQSKRRALTATKALTVSLKAESAEPSGYGLSNGMKATELLEASRMRSGRYSCCRHRLSSAGPSSEGEFGFCSELGGR